MSTEQGSQQTSLNQAGSGDAREHFWSYSPLMVVLPAEICADPMPVFGRILGRWNTRFVSRTEFVVTAIEGEVHLPALNLRLPGMRAPAWMDPDGNGLVRGALGLGGEIIPQHLRDVFPFANRGVVHPQQRFFRAVLSIEASFALVPGAALETGSILLHSIGHIGEGGDILETSSGIIMGGPFHQTVIACGCGGPRQSTVVNPAPAPTPAPCTATITITALTAHIDSTSGLVISATYSTSCADCDVEMTDISFSELSTPLTPNITSRATKNGAPGTFQAKSTYSVAIVGAGSTLTISNATLAVTGFKLPCSSCTPVFASAGMTCTIT